MTNVFNRLARALDGILPVGVADAHCDIPCGIYDPRDAIQAAQTVVKMTSLIKDLEKEGLDSVAARNSMIRYVMIKEEHATKCKDDLLVLWTDYFKPEHLDKHKDLHDKVWKACKLGSQCKQNVDLDKANALQKACEEIGEIFWATKK